MAEYSKPMSNEEKTKAVAVCDGCGQPVPIRVWPDGSVHRLGEHDRCCDGKTYRVLEVDTPDAFADD